jgi:hypothetical protein
MDVTPCVLADGQAYQLTASIVMMRQSSQRYGNLKIYGYLAISKLARTNANLSVRP